MNQRDDTLPTSRDAVDNPVAAAADAHATEPLAPHQASAPASTYDCAMFEAPSPRKVTVSPASRPLCSRIVSRSARSWHGWKSSESALTTGTVVPAAISSSPDCA